MIGVLLLALIFGTPAILFLLATIDYIRLKRFLKEAYGDLHHQGW